MSESGLHAGNIPLSYQLKHLARRIIGVAARGVPIPPEERALGCDVSHWNSPVNFVTMKLAGAKFCYFKATEGTTYSDANYNTYRPAAEDADMPFGSYHFLRALDGVAQANFFCNAMGANPGAMPCTVDVELSSVSASIIRALVTRIYDRLGYWPLIYSSAYMWSLVTGAADKLWIAQRCPLWVGNYGTDSPLLPPDWTNYVIHQYSADGNGLGHTYGMSSDDADLNRTRISWLNQYVPQLTLEERVTSLEARVTALESG